MKFFLLSDNVDTQVGMRLAGIDGLVIHEEEKLKQELEVLAQNPEIAIVLITEKLVNLSRDFLQEFRLKNKKPIIVEIPDRHGAKSGGKSLLAEYIQSAVGIKI